MKSAGLFNDRLPILATAVVPWTADLDFDRETFRREVLAIAHTLTPNIYIFGTAGEGYGVSEPQFDEIAELFWQVARECGAKPILGVISMSLATIIERINRGRELGFRQFQISLPSWGELNDRELERFFAETCGRFPDCQFHHYNLLRSRRLLTAREYLRLAEAHPNFVAVKSSASDLAIVRDLLTATPRVQLFFTEAGYTIARRTHDVGLLISLASVNYAKARAFVLGDDAGRTAAMAELHGILKLLLEIAGTRFHMDGAYDKMLYRLNDPTFPLRLLPPYASATENDFEKLVAGLPAGWR